MPKPRHVTTKGIAEEVGVSMQTVPCFINNRPDVATETRRQVQAVIAAHHKRPGNVAHDITQGRCHILR